MVDRKKKGRVQQKVKGWGKNTTSRKGQIQGDSNVDATYNLTALRQRTCRAMGKCLTFEQKAQLRATSKIDRYNALGLKSKQMATSFSYFEVFDCAPPGKWECICHFGGFESNNGWETVTIKCLIN